MTPGERERKFCLFLRQLELVASHDGDVASRSLFCELSGKVRARILAGGCAVDDVLDAVDRSVPSPTRFVALEDESTPPARPSALALEQRKRDQILAGFKSAWSAWWSR